MGTDEYNNSATPENDTGNSSNVEPVKLSRLATTALLVVLIFIVMILLITAKSCSIEKNSESENIPPISEGVNSSEAVEVFNTEIYGDVSSNFYENSSNSSYMVSTPSNLITYDNNSNVATSDTSSRDSLDEVTLPALSSVYETRGIVVAKHSYLFKGSYVYGLSLSILINDSTISVQYFCPKKTYDALSSADAINVSYQVDSMGRVSVLSISNG